MNDYSDLTPRRRRRTLLIVEGNHEKHVLFWLIFKCFPELQVDFDDVWVYGTNIYMLYDDIVREYDADWDEVDVDLPYLVSKKSNLNSIQRKNDFINVYLVFDYERHDPSFSEEKIVRLQKYFSDSTDVGQLYLNYPMIESYQDMPGFPDDAFMNHKVSVTVRPGSVYKGTIRSSVIARMTGLPQKIREILKGRFGIANNADVETCMLHILSLMHEETFVEDTISFLARYVNKQDAITAANQFEDLVKKQSYLSEGIDFWVHMKNVFKTIIRYHICKADRIVSNNESTLNYADRFRNINYQKILLAQNKVSADDDKGFIWVLNTSVLLVPEYNISLVSDRFQ